MADAAQRDATAGSGGLRRLLMVVLASAICVGGGYWAGIQHGSENERARLGDVEVERDRLAESVAELQKEYQQSRQQRVSLERGRAIDEQALNQARQSIVSLETRNAALRSDLAFYKNIMAPASVAKGLQIDRLSLAENPDGSFEFRLVLTQVGNNKQYQLGLVAVNLIGQTNGSREVIALRDVSPQINDLGVKFRFRYFQGINGTLTLPDGFEPLEIQVVAQPKGNKTLKTERTFSWSKLIAK